MTSIGAMREAATLAAKVLAGPSTHEGALVRYAEAVVTIPASMGEALAADAVEPAMADVVAALEGVGARRAKAVLLLNPAEVTPRVSLLCLVVGDGREPDAGRLTASIIQALDGSGFVAAQPVRVSPVEVDDVRTLLAHEADPVDDDDHRGAGSVIHRVDVLMEAEGTR